MEQVSVTGSASGTFDISPQYLYSQLTWVFQTGACIIALGYANFIIVPASDIFGRRITTLSCGIICIAANIWSATATSYQSFLGARILGGLGAAANESIMTMVVADIFFLHERGSYIGLYL